MKKSVYIETSIPSYLTARPSRDVRAAAWQQITNQWWEEARPNYDLFTSELVIVEASAGNPEAAARRLETLQGIAELSIDEEAQELADQLISKGGFPSGAEADALHVAVAAVHSIEDSSRGTFDTSIMRLKNQSFVPYALPLDIHARKSARLWNSFRRMKTMYKDEIIAEVWRNRDSYAEKHHHSLAQMAADLKVRQKRTECKLVDRRDRTKTSSCPAKSKSLGIPE